MWYWNFTLFEVFKNSIKCKIFTRVFWVDRLKCTHTHAHTHRHIHIYIGYAREYIYADDFSESVIHIGNMYVQYSFHMHTIQSSSTKRMNDARGWNQSTIDYCQYIYTYIAYMSVRICLWFSLFHRIQKIQIWKCEPRNQAIGTRDVADVTKNRIPCAWIQWNIPYWNEWLNCVEGVQFAELL